MLKSAIDGTFFEMGFSAGETFLLICITLHTFDSDFRVSGLFRTESDSGEKVNGKPCGNIGGIPGGNIGGIPGGSIGGMPGRNIGGIPGGNIGGMPGGSIGGMPGGNIGGMPGGSIGGMPVGKNGNIGTEGGNIWGAALLPMAFRLDALS